MTVAATRESGWWSRLLDSSLAGLARSSACIAHAKPSLRRTSRVGLAVGAHLSHSRAAWQPQALYPAQSHGQFNITGHNFVFFPPELHCKTARLRTFAEHCPQRMSDTIRSFKAPTASSLALSRRAWLMHDWLARVEPGGGLKKRL